MIDIFKPLSTFLQPVTPINLGNKDQTWDCWARSENVTSVPCSPPMAPFLSYHLMPEKEKNIRTPLESNLGEQATEGDTRLLV